MAKHVIFLGAGASYTSGYPLSADLRLILSSPANFRNYITDKVDKFGNIELSKRRELQEKLERAYASFNHEVQLFRDGGFATVDEFSYLARDRHDVFVQTLKRFTSIVFAVHNPENWYHKPGAQTNEATTAFQSSDYFPFIQKLFDETLHEFKDDVAVLTYNYDPYLEFLLSRAYRVRKKTSGEESEKTPTGVLSGFGDLDAKTLLKGKGFCFLKLHGTSVLPGFDSVSGRITDRDPLTFYEAFERCELLVSKLFEHANMGSHSRPPILFPWELFKNNGEFVSRDEFRANEGSLAQSDTRLEDSGSYYDVFKAIWGRAQKEIVDAETISFVGLSMHDFLKSGLRYLFAERVRKFEATVTNDFDFGLKINFANPGAWRQGDSFSSEPPPNSPVAKLVRILSEVNPKMALKPGQINTRNTGGNAVGRVMCHDSFKSFIESEL
jgi:hypothetical protein